MYVYIVWSKSLGLPLPNALTVFVSRSPFHCGEERFFMQKRFEPRFTLYQLKKYKKSSYRSHDAICSRAVSLLQGTRFKIETFYCGNTKILWKARFALEVLQKGCFFALKCFEPRFTSHQLKKWSVINLLGTRRNLLEGRFTATKDPFQIKYCFLQKS